MRTLPKKNNPLIQADVAPDRESPPTIPKNFTMSFFHFFQFPVSLVMAMLTRDAH